MKDCKISGIETKDIRLPMGEKLDGFDAMKPELD